jgi:hypothetical protein
MKSEHPTLEKAMKLAYDASERSLSLMDSLGTPIAVGTLAAATSLLIQRCLDAATEYEWDASVREKHMDVAADSWQGREAILATLPAELLTPVKARPAVMTPSPARAESEPEVEEDDAAADECYARLEKLQIMADMLGIDEGTALDLLDATNWSTDRAAELHLHRADNPTPVKGEAEPNEAAGDLDEPLTAAPAEPYDVALFATGCPVQPSSKL